MESRPFARTAIAIALATTGAHAQTTLYSSDGDSAGDLYGNSVSGAGDVNGDGIPDYIVGAQWDDNNGNDSGSARVFSGLDGSILYTFDGDAADDQLGSSVSGAGDVDADGFADLVVGAHFDDDTGTNAGSATVFSGFDGSILYKFNGNSGNDLFGDSVSGAGDVNGDGHADVIVGAWFDGPGFSGSALVFSGFDGSVLHAFAGDNTGDDLGHSVSCAGDVDGDGYADVIVGASDAISGGAGYARVYSGFTGAILHTFTGGSAGDQFGFATSGAGDVNNDGYADLIVGAYFDDNNGSNSGSARVFSGLDGSVLYSFDGDSAGDQFGVAVSGAGDVDGDDYDDFMVGADFDDNNGSKSGSVRVYSGFDGSVLYALDGDSAEQRLGNSLGGVGDLNGDDCADVIVASSRDDNNGIDSGSIRVVSFPCTPPDSDGDGLSDEDEIALGTDPGDSDSDDDGLSDGDEVNTYLTDPLALDTDGDGLSDGDEIAVQAFGCPDPVVMDTDFDGISDGMETALGLDPCDDADFDADGLMDAQEILTYGTNPFLPDTDGDGMLDGTEVDVALGTGCPDPLNPDSDGDGLSDGDEVDDMVGSPALTDPCNADTDGDTIPDDLDPLPTDPTGTENFVATDLRMLCDYVAGLDLSVFLAPNNNAAKGRRNAICNKLNAAANATTAGNFQGAIAKLESLRKKLDELPSPKDWMTPGTAEIGVVVGWIDTDIILLGYL